ncbi:MAG: Cof-type HAD-IIB family hydrolase [Erysipelotrichaceae bacterium]|nr:Cof-type HAD-IIB family hydrolase [Erysipelotrichaceae bacterium]
MYKVLVSDLDETLLRDDRTISEEDIKAIKAMRDHGYRFVPATGRAYETVNGTLKELGLFDLENEYVISYNGGCITENKNNKILFFKGLDFDLASEIYKRGINYDVNVHVYGNQMVYMYNLNEDEIRYLNNRMAITETDSKDIEFLRGDRIAKLVFSNTDYSYLKKIEEDFSDLKDRLSISYSSGRYIEFNPVDIDKGFGLRNLSKIIGVGIDQIVAIGDNVNDLPMIKQAGMGVGVANSNPDIIKDCGYITKATNNQSAIAECIHTFFKL